MSLKKVKLESELYRVKAARLESQARIIERQDEIQKIMESIALQQKREDELTTEFEKLVGEEHVGS